MKTRLLFLVWCIVLSACGTMNLSNTIAGGACGDVDYTIMFMGNHLLGVKASRQCVKEDSDENSDRD